MIHHVIEVGDVKIKMQEGVERILQVVKHEVELEKNLILLGAPDDDVSVLR